MLDEAGFVEAVTPTVTPTISTRPVSSRTLHLPLHLQVLDEAGFVEADDDGAAETAAAANAAATPSDGATSYNATDEVAIVYRSCTADATALERPAAEKALGASEKPLDKLRRVTALLRKVNAVAKRFAGHAKLRLACEQMRCILTGEDLYNLYMYSDDDDDDEED